MGTFSGGRTFRAALPGERMTKALDMPFGGSGLGGELANAGDQVAAGALSTYGLGTVIREGMTPQGNTRPQVGGSPITPGNPVDTLGRLAQNIGGMIRGDEAQPSMSEDDYKTSPYFRDEIPFEQGMTADRAAALAAFYDVRKTKEFFGQKRPWSTFAGQFVGQALDPVNYVPVFGAAADAAAVARLGTIAGRLVLGASDAAINTAAFGLLTSNMRSKFGDDVSWQAMVNEIGMSALVGGAFGGGLGTLAARREFNFAREDASRARSRAALAADIQNGITNKENMMASRPVLNEAATSLALTGDVSLSPNSAAVIERIQADVQSRTEGARAIERDTANVNTADKVAITPSGSRVNVRPEVVDASTLVPASGAMQVRNRTNVASNTQIEDMAINLDPARLMPSVEADSGAPIVGPDNIIDSGNGRVGAIVRAAQAYPAKYAAYRKALEDQGYDLTGIQTPVLINRRTTDLSQEARVQFNAEANAPRAAQMNAVEIAAMDRSALTDGVLQELDGGPINGAGNRAFVARFLDNLGQSEKGALIDNVGNLNADGVRRIENALIASAYGDVDAGVIRRFAEATDDNTRAIVGAMSDVAGKWTLMRRAIKSGDISPEFDVTPELTDALRMIGQWRDQAAREKRPVSQVIKEGMAQIDMLSGEVSPETQVLIGAFYQSNSFARAAGRETIADFLGKVTDAATELGRPQLFETADVGKLELLKNVASNEQGNLFTPAGTVDGIEADGGFNRAATPAADRQNGGSAVGENGRASVEPPVPEGMRRVYHSGSIGEGETGRWVSSNRKYASDYRGDLPLHYLDLPANDPRINNPDYADQGIDNGFTFNFELKPEEATNLKEIPRAADSVAAAQPVPSIGEAVVLRDLPDAQQKAVQNDFIKSQPARSLDELYAVAGDHQAELGHIGTELGRKYGADFRDPGLKSKATSADKMERKRYDSTSRLTDVVRAGYVVKTPDQVDNIIADLAKTYPTVDEGWRMTAEAYFDRKVMVQFPDGTIGEVQFWHPDLLDAKDGRGHALYEEMRALPQDDPRYEGLRYEQRQVYMEAISKASDEWLPVVDQLLTELSGRPASGNMASNVSGRNGAPESMTSSTRTGTQSAPSDTTAQAELPSMTAGRPSQSKNSTVDAPDVAGKVGTASLAVNDNVEHAAARVGKPEDIKQIAASHGVDPVTGGFVEQADIAQLREEGRLSKAAQDELDAADAAFDTGEAFGRALAAAVACII